ncbi:MAG: phosphate uptake regulator PhoU [Candidatus Nitrosocaldus sp.]
MKYTRKVQRIGSSLLISLPKEWVESNGIDRGSIILIESANDNSLRIYPALDEVKESKEVVINYPSPYYEPIANKITGAYLLGYDLIKVKSNTPISYEERESIKEAIERLVSLEIVDEDATHIVAQFLLDATTLDAEKILYRISTIVSGMYRDVITALQSRDKGILKSIVRRDDEVDRQYFLLVRLLRSLLKDQRLAGRMNLTSIEVLDYRLAAHLLESAGDGAVELARAVESLLEYGIYDHSNLVEIAEVVKRIQDTSVKAFISHDRKGSIEVMKQYSQLSEYMSSIKQDKEDTKVLDFMHLLDKFARIWVDIADLVMPIP